MAPYDVTHWGSAAEPVVHLLIGTGFGFVLERAGFGSAKKLTNQFYLNDMTVLKVMFTAIITAMVLILLFVTFGWMDFDKLWVNPTYLGSGIVGGLIFGVGFVVGGYCPGTALVSAATLKLDGLLFVLGVLGGIFAFGFTEPLVDAFWNDSGNFGRLTLMDWLGLPMPVVVLLAVLLALGFFAGGEWVERLVNRGRDGSVKPIKRWRPAYGYAAVLLGGASLSLLAWNATEGLRTQSTSARIESRIHEHRVQLDPRELADLMQDKRLSLVLLDLRDEASFNRFHLLDARRFEVDSDPKALAPLSVKVIIGSDEPSELDAYRRLARRNVDNLYVLAGGLPSWTALFDARGCDQRLAALGAQHPWSRPTLIEAQPVGAYASKVKRPGLGAKKSGGGCGG